MFLNVKRSLHRSQTKPSCTWHVAKQARKAAVKVQIPYPLVAHSRNLSLKQTKAAQAHSRIFLDERVFGSVVVVAFQSAFHSEKYANNIFLFFKNHF
jgi:hypothetical protein